MQKVLGGCRRACSACRALPLPVKPKFESRLSSYLIFSQYMRTTHLLCPKTLDRVGDIWYNRTKAKNGPVMVLSGGSMNPHLQNLSKIEFVITNACTGRCKHCSEGNHTNCGESINPTVAADAVRRVGALYDLQTVMTFGGEPLLYPDAVCEIMTTAKELNIPRRQVITNGYFSKNTDTIREVAQRLAACGVNDLLLSVDAFHQETIPAEVVKTFAREAQSAGIPLRLSPAWLVSPDHNNPYNRRTKEILSEFTPMNIPVGSGNVIFPEGNARKYLAEYFTDEIPENPYVEDPADVRCLSFSPNGDVLDRNVYERDILEILRDYKP